jgi:hypothetical protein
LLQEDEQLLRHYRKWGNSWTKIAQFISGRTDNAVSSMVRLCGAHTPTSASAHAWAWLPAHTSMRRGGCRGRPPQKAALHGCR